MFEAIERQQKDMMVGRCPISIDQRILSIPIIEQGEGCIDIEAMNHAQVFMMPKPQIPFSSPNCSAGFECSKFVRKSVWERLVALSENLSVSFKFKVGIAVFEGLRDIQTQKEIRQVFSKIFRDMYDTVEEAEKNLNSLVSDPINVPYLPFSTGANVSIRLMNLETLSFIDMGQFGLLWGDNKEANTFSANLTEEQKMNRGHLITCAAIAGLVNYPYEWWHFSFGDRYFCYYTNNKSAVHGTFNFASKEEKV
jgi:D-alanyl-D-alanine dipeptidase